MVRGLIKYLTPILILFLIGCEFLARLFTPSPWGYTYHTHKFFLHIKTVNSKVREDDTDLEEGSSPSNSLIREEVAVKGAKIWITSYLFSRPGESNYEINEVGVIFPKTLTCDLSKTNTAGKTYQNEIIHFVGYQNTFGGDTNWKAYIRLEKGLADLGDGRFVEIASFNKLEIPDTVRGDLDVEVLFNWNGLFYGDTTRIYLNPKKIKVRQRD